MKERGLTCHRAYLHQIGGGIETHSSAQLSAPTPPHKEKVPYLIVYLTTPRLKGTDHRLISYINTKAKCRHLKRDFAAGVYQSLYE